MTKTVLVIDSNSAVQAITTLALNQTDCTVETLADGGKAYQRIRQLSPSVVLCAKDIAGVDPFELCKTIKSELKKTAFVLLAPAEGVQATAELAKNAHFDEVIYKPFKSNRLREVVTSLMLGSETTGKHALSFFLTVGDSLRRRIIERYLTKHSCPVFTEASPPPAFDGSVIAVVDAKSQLPAGFPGKSIVFEGGSGRGGSPLTQKQVSKLFEGLVQEHPPVPFTPGSAPVPATPAALAAPHLSPESSQTAAEISARIFSKLLISPAVQAQDWEEVAKIAAAEVKKHPKSARK